MSESTVLERMTKPIEHDSTPTGVIKIQGGPFDGIEVHDKPLEEVCDRASLKYRADDEGDLGDVLIVDNREMSISPRSLRSLIKVMTLKSDKWFLRNFDATTRDKMFRDLTSSLGSMNLRLFYKETPNGLRLLNAIDATKPLLSDYDAITIAGEIAARGDYGIKVRESKVTPTGIAIKFYYENGVDLADFFEDDGSHHGKPKSDLNYFGATFSNSQLGFYSPTVDGYTFRPICQNGAVTSSAIAAWDTIDADNAMSVEDLRDWYRTELMHIMSKRDELIAKAKVAITTKASPTLMNEVAIESKISASAIKAVYDAYMKEPDIREWGDEGTGTSVWSISQAFTRAAQNFKEDDPTRAILEKIGGDIVYK